MNRIKIVKGDITKISVDAIVNAANNSLLGGGGVDGAIHRAGGKAILEECVKIREKQGGCETGEAVITTAGRLNAKYVIHTVGPIWHGGANNEKQLLINCYVNSLKLAVEHKVRTIAFPNISTGVYRFPKELAAEIAVNTVRDFLKDNSLIEEIIFVCFNDDNYELYYRLLNSERKHIKVTCAIIENSGRILVAQRNANMSMPLKWEFPGGKLEASETPEECIVREISEELGIEIKIKQKLEPNTHIYETNTVELIPYVCEIVSGELMINEHKKIIWEYPENLKDIDWAEADIPIYNQYINSLQR